MMSEGYYQAMAAETDAIASAGMSEATAGAARAGHISADPPPDHWTTQDGGKIPFADLGDGHLINILKMLRRQAVARNAARSVRWARVANRFAAVDIYDGPAFEDYESTWRAVLPAIWKPLMAQARARPSIVNEAEAIEADDLAGQQARFEIAIFIEARGGES